MANAREAKIDYSPAGALSATRMSSGGHGKDWKAILLLSIYAHLYSSSLTNVLVKDRGQSLPVGVHRCPIYASETHMLPANILSIEYRTGYIKLQFLY